jgi:DNA-binding CsgD family transcriptional regulator
LIDIQAMNYLHFSSNAHEITGWPRSEYMQGGVEFAFSRILQKSQVGIGKFSIIINNYFKQLSEKEKRMFRCYWDWKTHIPNGKATLLLQDCILRWDSDGRILVLLTVVMEVTHLKNDKTMHMRLTNGKENLIYEFEMENEKLTQLQFLSKRELQVAQLVNRGYTNAEIADQLSVSIHTIHTHRRNMLQKMNVKDFLELSNLLKVLGVV